MTLSETAHAQSAGVPIISGKAIQDVICRNQGKDPRVSERYGACRNRA
jgi:hypothetical protein